MNILVTAIGSFSADCVINSLKASGHTVIGCDIYPSEWHAVSKDCDKVYQAPYATEERRYIQFLIDVSNKHKIEYLFPLTDLEIDVLNQNRSIFEQYGITLCIPSLRTLAVARNKYILYKTFEEDESVPTIPTVMCGSNCHCEMMLPAIAKPYNGRSSEGLMRITTVADFQKMLHTEGYIIQQIFEGSVFTVDYIRNNNTGQDFSIAREELLRTKNGAGTTVKITNDLQLATLVSHIGEKIQVNGCINMEFIKHNGQYFLIDINPRFSAGVAFSHVAGYNMVLNHLNCFIGTNIQAPIIYKEQIITKRYKEEIIQIYE